SCPQTRRFGKEEERSTSVGESHDSSPEKDAGGLPLLSASNPYRTAHATEDNGMNDWKAQCIERCMLRLAEVSAEKDCHRSTSLAAYSTRKTAWGPGVRPK